MEFYLYVLNRAGFVAYEVQVTQKGFYSFFQSAYSPDDDFDIRFEVEKGHIFATIYEKDSDYDIGFISFTSNKAFIDFLKE